MINELIALATHLDRKGYGKEADYIDAVIKKAHGADSDEEGDPHGSHEDDMHTLQGGTWHPERGDDGDTEFETNVEDALLFIKQKSKENDGEFHLTNEPDWDSERDTAHGIWWGSWGHDGASMHSSEGKRLAEIIVNRANKQFGTDLEVGYTPTAGYFEPGELGVLREGLHPNSPSPGYERE